MKKYILLISILAICLISLNFISAWNLEKHLVQTEVDPNYPCYIENEDTIVCPALDNSKIEEWKNKIEVIPETIKDKEGKDIINPEKDIGKFDDSG
jgi:hypothetical protein